MELLVILKIQTCTDMKLGVLILLSAFLSGGCVCPAQAAGAVRVCSCENNSEGGYVISQSWQRANMTFMVMKCPKEHVPTWKCRTNWF